MMRWRDSRRRSATSRSDRGSKLLLLDRDPAERPRALVEELAPLRLPFQVRAPERQRDDADVVERRAAELRIGLPADRLHRLVARIVVARVAGRIRCWLLRDRRR